MRVIPNDKFEELRDTAKRIIETDTDCCENCDVAQERDLKKLGELFAEADAAPPLGKAQVIIDMYGGCIDDVHVFLSDVTAVEFFIGQMAGDGKPEGAGIGFADVDEAAFGGDRLKYAQALYKAHHDAIERDAAFDGQEYKWYEEEVQP